MKKLLAGVLVLLLQGCGGMKPGDFTDQEPKLDLFTYFEGQTLAWGWFEDRFGKIRRQFKVTIDGRIEGEALILDEDFVYRDGELAKRIWTISRTGPNQYRGTADDVVGEAVGTASGNALNWRYTLALPIGESVWNVQFDDWMFLQEDGVMLNRAVVTKFGLELGRVSIFFSKPSASSGSS